MRTNYWPAAVVALAVAILAVVGCTSRTPTTQVASQGSPPRPAPENDDPNAKMFADWPTPAGALFITGEQIGYLAPCGCSEEQKGGLIRRMILMERLRAQGWPLVPIDLGSLLNDPTKMGGMDETKIRYGTALTALETLDYKALAFSASDLKIGVQEVLGQLLNRDRIKVVAANVTPDPAMGLESKFVPSVRTSAGPIKVGITAVLDPSALKDIRDPDVSLLTTKPPEEVLTSVLGDLEKDTDVQVLMVQGAPEVARRLAKAYPGFDIVVGTSVHVDPPAEPEMLNDGKTRLITVGHKGQYVGVVGLYQDEPRFRYGRVTLHNRFDKTPSLAKLGEPMRKLLDEQFPTDLKAFEVIQKYPRRPYLDPEGNRSDAVFVGSEACKDCHPRSYERWAKSGHGKAYRGLTKPERNREYDAYCVSCHTTGFEYVGGYVAPDQTPLLKNNGCENCHGPGSKHVAEPDNKEFLRAIARDAVDFEESYRCLTCHDADNDTDFKFGRDWTKIDHTGLDSYDDPKVHRGAAPKVARQEK